MLIFKEGGGCIYGTFPCLSFEVDGAREEMLIINNKLLMLALPIFLILPNLALSAEKSVIVGFHQRPGTLGKTLIQKAKGKIKRSYRLINAMSVRISGKGIEKLKKNKMVAYVEEDGIVTAVKPLPGDEYVNAWGVGHIGADVAHASGNKGTGIKIAVIDSGIDYTHEDLDDNYAGGYDFVFDDDDPFDDSFESHGTHVAGIIAAEENGIGVIGVAPEADLYAVKVLDGGGVGLVSWVIAGIEWAVDNGMDIAALSLEGPHYESLQAACDSAYNAGLLVVAAGGNSRVTGGPVKYPAAYNSVIAVTGTDADNVQAYFSPVGPELELAAPGVAILSTVSVANGSYSSISGTSQAAPHVAGTAALFVATVHDENGDGKINDEVREMLQMTAIDLGEAGFDDIYGFGLVNAAAASGGDCPDNDSDGYVVCDGICDSGALLCGECDNSDENVNPSASELCDSIDNNCNSEIDEEVCELCPIKEIFGTYSEETQLLRYFRDDVLSKTPEGQEVIRLYYAWSPAIVKTMEEDEEFREEVKEMIDEVFLLMGYQDK